MRRKSTLSGTVSISSGTQVPLSSALLGCLSQVQRVRESTSPLSYFLLLVQKGSACLWDPQPWVKPSSAEGPRLTHGAARVQRQSWAQAQFSLTPGPLSAAAAAATSLWTDNLPHLAQCVYVLSSLALELLQLRFSVTSRLH